MSIVGPRPHAVAPQRPLPREVVDNYMQRHRVKPGITGWAQVKRPARRNRHRSTMMAARVEYDRYYTCRHWSLVFDLRNRCADGVQGD
jgi:lipopolysaccharide/colanic/teichoic acid biosynthesis glycosyltransferase